MYNYKTILFTRFGMKNVKFKLGEKWEYNYENRLKILLKYTKFSIENQINLNKFKDFTWCFLIGDYVTQSDMYTIRENIDNRINIDFLYINENDMKTKINDKYKLDGNANITIRIDSDDYLHPNGINKICETLNKHFDGNNIVISGPSYGYKYFPSIKLYTDYYRPKLALGLGIISKHNTPVITYHHLKIKDIITESIPNINIIEDYDIKEPLFINNKHINSVSVGWGDYQKEISKEEKNAKTDNEIKNIENEFKMTKDIINNAE